MSSPKTIEATRSPGCREQRIVRRRGGYFVSQGETNEQARTRHARMIRQHRKLERMMRISEKLNTRPMQMLRAWAETKGITALPAKPNYDALRRSGKGPIGAVGSVCSPNDEMRDGERKTSANTTDAL